VDPVPVISKPRLLAGTISQVCAWAVTSTSKKLFATLTGAVVKTPLTVGWVLKVTVPSFQDVVASAKLSVPPVTTLSTYTRK
jgi:hypothetical protein